jgi:hypothetical protein
LSSFAIIIIIVTFLVNFQWDLIKNLWPFSIFNELQKLKSAVVFLSIYATLNRSGAETRQIIEIYKTVEPKIAGILLKAIDAGGALSSGILEAGFPDDWAKTASAVVIFENPEVKNKAIEGLFKILKKNIKKQAEKVNGFISSIGKATVLLALVMILAGFYLPAIVPS